jgi:hypothetical protein
MPSRARAIGIENFSDFNAAYSAFTTNVE